VTTGAIRILPNRSNRFPPRVAEDGPDTFNSESDSDSEQHGDVIMDAYVGIKTDSNGNPVSAEHKISSEQAESQRRADIKPKESATGKDIGGGGVPKGHSTGKRKTKKTRVPASQPVESSHSMSARSKSKNEERVAGGARVAAGSG
jgi:hypothetical protein